MQALALTLICAVPFPTLSAAPVEASSFLAQPAYDLREIPKGPYCPYTPQPGDIFLATDQDRLGRLGHALAGGAGVHHSGIVFRTSTGELAILESGPFNNGRVDALVPFEHMGKHVEHGDRVWIRRRLTPLTCEQSARLTAFAEAQVGKPFASARVYGQLLPFRSRGILRTPFLGKPQGDRPDYFCSELVMECLVAAGVIDARTARPAATYPRDLFFGSSRIPYLNRHLRLEDQWQAPARWVSCPVGNP